jgi:hypothetical protein
MSLILHPCVSHRNLLTSCPKRLASSDVQHSVLLAWSEVVPRGAIGPRGKRSSLQRAPFQDYLILDTKCAVVISTGIDED